jgi:hypothetical protein
MLFQNILPLGISRPALKSFLCNANDAIDTVAVDQGSRMKTWIFAVAAMSATWAIPASADTAQARCDIYPAGSDQVSDMIRCAFSQRQGVVTIIREDGVTHVLSPTGEAVGNFEDQDGRTVYRQSGLGDQGLIFRFPDESVFLYWNASVFDSDITDDLSGPFSTNDYDATVLLNCRATGASAFDQCPAGILRMEDQQASIVVQNPAGEQFTINFMNDYVNATNRQVDVTLDNGIWTVIVNDTEIYEVPVAAIEGG